MKTKLVYIIGAIVIGLASTLAIIFGLVGGDVVDIEKTNIVFESASASAIYDGTEFTCNEYQISSGSLKEGHTAQVSVYGSQTVVGCSLNYMSVVIVDENNTDVTDNYIIDKKLGTLTVEKAPLVLTSKSQTKQYDGTSLDYKYYDIGTQSKLAAGNKIVTDFTQSILYVGSIPNSFSVKVLDESGANVTANYDITKEYGLLVVIPRNITIKSGSSSKIYDGTPLEDPSYTIKDDAIVEGNFLNYTNDTSITNVGIIENDFTCTIVDMNNNDVTKNYEITYVKGKLQVGVKSITISSNTTTQTYTGLPIKCEEYTIEDDAIAQEDTLTVSYLNSRTEVGTTPNEFSWVVLDENGEDVTANYIVNKVIGSIIVTPIDIVFESATKRKTYDGTPLENEDGDLTIKEGALAENQTVNYRAYTSITTAQDNVPNAISPIILDANGNNVSTNYNISSNEGTFTIFKRDISISSISDSKVYDGTKLENGEPTIVGTAADGQTLTVTLSGDSIYLGTVANDISYTILDDVTSEDMSENYNIELNIGLLGITARPLNITSDSDGKVYDGTPLTKESYSLGSTTVAPTDTLAVTFTKSITNVGSCENEFTYTIVNTETGEDMSGNYIVASLYDLLMISQRPLTIKTESISSSYTGEQVKAPGYSLESTTLADTDTLTITSADKYLINVGSIENSYTYTITNNTTGDNVIANYNITEEFGDIEVTAVTLKVKVGSDEKVYDGTPLTNSSYTITSGNLVLDHQLSFSMTSDSQITKVGTCANEADEDTVYIYDGSHNNVTSNYIVTFTPGELEVTPRDLTIRSNDKTAEYTGSPLVCDEYTITYGSIASTDYIVTTIDGALDYIGSAYNTFAAVKLYRRSSNASSSLLIKEGETVVIDGVTLNSSYNITLLGFNSSFTKYYVEATNDYANYLKGMVPATWFEATPYYDVDSDIDVTTCYNLEKNVGQLILVYSKETTGLTKQEEYEAEYEVLQVKADQDGPIYLRSYSYTTYYGNAWSKGTEYNQLLDNKYSYNYLTSAFLEEKGITPTSTMIKLTKAPYVIPYYTVMNDSQDTIQTSDVLYSGVSSEYSVDYYSIDYSDIKLLSTLTYDYSDEELEYYEYVKSKYLQIPDSTKTYLQSLITSNSISSIDDVIYFVSHAAAYNMSYDRTLDSELDKVKAFLGTYKEGVCSHFAEACTMMLRAMNIPARYVSGYYAYGKAGDWVSITNMKRHAWTEVYLQGIGWVQIDATGGSIVKDDTDADSTKKYSVKPEDCYYQASSVTDGENYILYSNNRLTGVGLNQLLEKGYTYKKVEIVNYQIGFGSTYCSIDSFALLDPNGYDVTKDFKFIYSGGKLQVYLQEFSLASNSIDTEYDGTSHSDTTIKINGVTLSDPADAPTLAGLASGHYFDTLEITASLTAVGEVQNTIHYIIKDGSGHDVTSYYRVTENSGSIVIREKQLELTAGSSTSTYNKADPTPLTCSTYTITGGGLATGDTITDIEFSGSQLKPGTCNNEIVSVVIKNSLGEDVTSCYQITTVVGTLTVNKPTV